MNKRGYILQSFRSQNTSLDQNSALRSFNTIDRAIDEIYNSNASQLSFEELYRNAYQLCVHKYGDILYDGVKQSLFRHLQKSLQRISTSTNEDFLSSLVREWSLHQTSFNRLKDILLYMDRSYCIQKKKLSVYYYAIQLFRDEVIYSDGVKEKVRSLLLEQVMLERKGFVIDRDVMKNVISMLVILGSDSVSTELSQENSNSSTIKGHSNLSSSNLVYKNPYEEEFEVFFLIETEQFYKTESLEYLSFNSCQDYLRKVEMRLCDEFNRISGYLCSSSEPKLRAILDCELISTHSKTLLEMDTTGLDYMLTNHKLDDLSKLFSTFSRVTSSLEMLRDYFGRHIEQRGLEIVNSQDTSKDPIVFVQKILDLKEKFDEIIHKCMKEEKKLMKKLKESFELFINKDNRVASYLANYIDDLFKNDNAVQSSSEEEMEVRLEKVLVIFRFISDKDIFENYYKALLAKRLLSGRVISDDNERSLIAKLKSECGYQFTSKLEGMLMDMTISKAVMEDFRRLPSYDINSCGVEFEVQLLTAGYWPLELPSRSLDLPSPLVDCCRKFTSFYTERNNGRKLLWMTNMGQVDVKANFPNGRKDFNVSTYQAMILLEFNFKTSLTLVFLREATQIPEIELKRHLLSLCTSKVKILVKASKGKGIENNDEFTYNSDYTSKLKRVKVPLVALKEIVAEDDSTRELIPAAVEEDRRHLVEAAVVRIMKARKTLSHNELIAEVTKQIAVRFNPSPQFIKKRIESLIEREYLKRHEEDSRLYNYLA